MTQSVTITQAPSVVNSSVTFEVDLAFGEAVTDFSGMQLNINNGAGWFDLVPGGGSGFVTATDLAGDGLSAAILLNNGSLYAARSLQFSIPGGGLSNSVPFMGVNGMTICRYGLLELYYPQLTPLQIISTNGINLILGYAGLTIQSDGIGQTLNVILQNTPVAGQLFVINGNIDTTVSLAPSDAPTFTYPFTIGNRRVTTLMSDEGGRFILLSNTAIP